MKHPVTLQQEACAIAIGQSRRGDDAAAINTLARAGFVVSFGPSDVVLGVRCSIAVTPPVAVDAFATQTALSRALVHLETRLGEKAA